MTAFLFRDAKPTAAEKSRRRALRGQDRENAQRARPSARPGQSGSCWGWLSQTSWEWRHARAHRRLNHARRHHHGALALPPAGVQLADRDRILARDPRSPAFARMSCARPRLALDPQVAGPHARPSRRSGLPGLANAKLRSSPKGEPCRLRRSRCRAIRPTKGPRRKAGPCPEGRKRSHPDAATSPAIADKKGG